MAAYLLGQAVRVLLDRHFMSISDIKNEHHTLSDTQVPCSIPHLPYMFVGTPVSRK